MFGPGDEIVCIDDSPNDNGSPFGLARGQVFRVLAMLPAGSPVGHGGGEVAGTLALKELAVSIGVDRPALRDYCRTRGFVLATYDLWPPERFRRVQRKDISRGLAALKSLCRPTEERIAA